MKITVKDPNFMYFYHSAKNYGSGGSGTGYETFFNFYNVDPFFKERFSVFSIGKPAPSKLTSSSSCVKQEQADDPSTDSNNKLEGLAAPPKPRKPFESMTEKGKRLRLQCVMKRDLAEEELDYLVDQMTKKRRTELAPADKRAWDDKEGLDWW
jgi:hypothetical protein